MSAEVLILVATAVLAVVAICAAVVAVRAVRRLSQVPAPEPARASDVIAIRETDPDVLEPDVLEYKLYAPRVGPVLSLTVSGGSEREELVRMDKASAAWVRRAGTAPLGQGPIPPAGRSR